MRTPTLPTRPPRDRRYGWFRLYNGFSDHPKWRAVAQMVGLRVTDVIAIAVKLLECANKGHPRGALDKFSVLETGAAYDIDPQKVEHVYKRFEVLGWIEQQYLTTWDERQPDKEDPTSAQRTARRRHRRMALGLEKDFDGSVYYPHLALRDGEKCIYCLCEDALEVDHIVSIAEGGTDKMDNLGLACRSCNARKGGRPLAQTGMMIVIESAFRAHERFLAAGVTPLQTPRLDTESKKEAEPVGIKIGGEVNWEQAEAWLGEQRKHQLKLPLPPVLVAQRGKR
jgi:5-methylcytosine-specific restriction endonuclease McrA